MAGEDRRSSINLKLDLLEKGHEFSFFQALRLLRRLGKEVEKPPADFEGKIKIRPHLSLAFPAADIAQIEEDPTSPFGFSVTATFLGLYGSSSPLPTFYTEDLLAEAAEEESVTRDFIDIFNQRIYTLLYQCWLKYRQFLQVVEERNPLVIERLFCLLGLGEVELRQNIDNPYSLLRYLGLFTQFPRSSLGLITMLRDFLSGINIEIIPCPLRQAKIPLEQRSILGKNGCSLGVDMYLGEEIPDRMGKFILRIGPLRATDFQALLPGNSVFERLIFLTKLYVSEPLEFEIELILGKGETRPTCLGSSQWSRLGLDTWIYAGEWGEEGQVKIPN